ncbi:MAG TPA: pyridoxal-phosphate dependent enzyme, partial [Porticoccaceae bacterium]|nr:pyridoxal-phosphate dependent enzyme [Porticoccaceae bacterium]
QNVQIIGLQPEDGASIPGIRRWPQAYMPGIFNEKNIDQVIDISQTDAENTMRRLVREEGIFCGASSGGAVFAALELSKTLENSVIVTIICDRGDRYLSSGIYA